MSRPGARTLGALAAAWLLAGAASAQETAQLRRYADIVAVRASRDAHEEVLYFFDPTRELPQGAQVQQGSGAFTELHLSGGAVIAAHASTHLVIERLAPEGDVVRVALMNLLEVEGGTRKLELLLPGDTRCALLDATLLIEVVPGRLRIRNQKGDDVRVTGRVGPPEPGASAPAEPGQGSLMLGAGQEIQIPLYSGEDPGAGMTARRWVGRVVRHGSGAVVAVEGARLRVGRTSDGEIQAAAEVEVGGVVTHPGRGRLIVRDPRPSAPPEAPAEAPAPAPAVTPPEGTPATDTPAGPPPEGGRPDPEEDSP